MKLPRLAILPLLLLSCVSHAAAPAAATLPAAAPLQITSQLDLGAPDHWDYLQVDTGLHRVFVAHRSRIDVVDTRTLKRIGSVDGIQGAHGVATDATLGLGFASEGLGADLAIFDLRSLRTLQRVPTGQDSDAVAYWQQGHLAVVGNGDGHSLSLVDVIARKRLANIPLDGSPEAIVVDTAGRAWVNVSDRSEILRIDLHRATVEQRWSIPICTSPHGLAFDAQHHRLFSSCRNGHMLVVDSDDGHQVADLPIGQGTDAAAFDAKRQLAFSSNADGSLDVIHEDNIDQFQPVSRMTTAVGARTLTIDPESGAVFLAAPSVDKLGARLLKLQAAPAN